MIRTTLLVLTTAAALAAIAGGCEKEPAPTPATPPAAPADTHTGAGTTSTGNTAADAMNHAGDKVADTADATKDAATDGMAKMKEEFLAGARTTVDSAEEQIAKAETKLSTLPEAVRSTSDAIVKSARDHATAAKDEIARLSSATFDTQAAWDSAKANLEATLTKLNDAVKSVVDKVGL